MGRCRLENFGECVIEVESVQNALLVVSARGSASYIVVIGERLF